MSVKDLLSSDSQIQLVVNTADLREFALTLAEEFRIFKSMEPEQMYTPTEFAKRHNVSKGTLWRWCKIGVLKPVRIGGKVYYRDSDLTR